MPIVFLIAGVIILSIAVVVWASGQKKDEENTVEDDEVGETTQASVQIVHEIGIPELIGKLYNDHIRDLPVWIKDDKFYLRPFIAEAVDLGKEYDPEGIKIKTKVVLNGKVYIFSFREYNMENTNGSWQLRGELEVSWNGNKVLGLTMNKEQNKENSKWKFVYVDMFIEGDWIEDFQELERRIEQEKQRDKTKESRSN